MTRSPAEIIAGAEKLYRDLSFESVLYAAMEMAQTDEPVSVSSLRERYQIPEGALAKIMQDLVRAGFAVAVEDFRGRR